MVVSTVEASFSWREPRAYPTFGPVASGTDTSVELVVGDLDQETLENAHLKIDKNEEILVNIGSRLFA